MDEKSKAKFKEIESEYNELVHGYGAVTEEVTRIGRDTIYLKTEIFQLIG
jgi:hypothetical protein